MMYELILAKKKVEEAALMAEQIGSKVTAQAKVNRYEYDSDEDTEGGTWEHKQRTTEMEATRGQINFTSVEHMVVLYTSVCHMLRCNIHQ